MLGPASCPFAIWKRYRYALKSLKILRPDFELISHFPVVSILLVLPLIESLYRSDQIS